MPGTLTTVTSFCRACPANCGVKVTVREGVPVRIQGDDGHPLSRGYVCPKGRKAAALPDDPRRLDRPMMRDPGGHLVPVDWDEVIADLGDRLTAIRESSGAYAIGNYSGTTLDSGGRYAALRLMSALGSPSRYTSSTVDSVAKVLVPKMMAGREGLVPAMDFDHTTLLLIFGENMVVSHGGFSYFPDPVRYLRSVASRGEVWVFDPRRTETARLGTRHLSPRAGTDFAVLGYLVRALLEEGADGAYLDRHARGLDGLRQAVYRFDHEFTVQLTGLDGDELLDLLATVRTKKRLSVITGTGVTMAATANVTEWLAYALQIVTGSFERPGGRWFNHTATFAPSRSTPPDTSQFGPGPRTNPSIPRMANQYPCAVMPEEIEQGHLKALLVTGGNPMVAFPQPDRIGRALDSLEVLAVWDIIDSAVATRATHLLPCPDPLERADLIAPVHLSMVYAQYTPAVVPVRGQRQPMWWSLAKVAERMGLSILPGGVPPDTFREEELFRSMVEGTPVAWPSLEEAAGAPVRFPYEDRWVERTVLADERWDLSPPLLVERLEVALSRPHHPLVLGNRRQVQHTNSTMAWSMADRDGPSCRLHLNPLDAAAAGIAEGDRVEVRSVHGSVITTACLDDSYRPGHLALPHGFSEPNVGHLTSTDVDVDPLTGMPTLVGIPVSIARVAVGPISDQRH